jgi:phosphoadenosine phosphosulfate reductase
MAIASPPTSEPGNALSEAVIETIQQGKLASWDAERVLGWAIETFHPRLVLSASFGAPEGMVLLDLMHRIEPGVRVYTLDTGRLPQATHDLIDRVRDRYGVAVEVVFPDQAEVVEMVRRGGQNLFYESVEKRQLCCRIRKVEPMRRYFATAGIDAWVAGLRRGQGVTREEVAKIEIDEKHGGLVKINPLVDWTLEQVWEYVREHNVPVNRLHKQGYPSVGCDPCSRAIQPGEDIRAGRWWWENPETKECGIHVEEESHGSGI